MCVTLPGDYAGFPGCGLLRLHSTYRHDLKIYASDEGRVQMTAAAFAKVIQADAAARFVPQSRPSQLTADWSDARLLVVTRVSWSLAGCEHVHKGAPEAPPPSE